MSGRPSDWSAVGFPADPTPGDPAVVRDGARRYFKVADAIQSCAAGLRALDTEAAGQAESVRALLRNLDAILDGAGSAEASYRTAGAALDAYALNLDRVQSDSLLALYAAQLAAAEIDEAARRRQHFLELADDYANSEDEHGQDQYSLYTKLADWASEDVVEAKAEIGRQHETVRIAVEERDQAARNAIDAINEALRVGNLSDFFRDT